MKSCIRPHCAIRSHNHDLSENTLTFAKLHNYLPKFCDIADRYPLNNKELINNYNFLLKSYDENTKREYLDIFINLLKSIDEETILELKRLRILYLFTMVSTPSAMLLRIINPELAEAIRSSYYRMLREAYDDEDFITQIIYNYRM